MNPNWVETQEALQKSRQLADEAKTAQPPKRKVQYHKSEVGFEHPAKGPEHCSQCVHFRGTGLRGCEIVLGYIRREDWCKKFAKRGAS